jgi:hypothetical protein
MSKASETVLIIPHFADLFIIFIVWPFAQLILIFFIRKLFRHVYVSWQKYLHILTFVTYLSLIVLRCRIIFMRLLLRGNN